MSFPGDDWQADDDAKSRLEVQLLRIRQEFGGHRNRVLGFAHVRENYPEAAQILYCGRDLRFTDLRGADLRGIDFRGSDLSGCDFAGASIVDAHLELAKVSRDALKEAEDWRLFLDNWKALAPPMDIRRHPGERFGVAPYLPELVVLPPELLGEKTSGSHLTDREREFLATGRLAIAFRCVTVAEWGRVDMSGTANSGDNPAYLRPFDAGAYAATVTRQAEEFGLPRGTIAVLPSVGLFFALASASRGSDAGKGLRAKTDLLPGDLELGGDFEFVERQGDNGVTTVTTAGFENKAHRRASHVSLKRAPHAGALLRPVFFLGED